MIEHRHTKLYYPRIKRHIEVDVGMATLIKGLWDLDIHTKYCCRGDSYRVRKPDRFAYIMFLNEKSARKFMCLTEKIEQAWEWPDAREAWIWELSPNVSGKNFKKTGRFNFVVRFPSKDIRRIVNKL